MSYERDENRLNAENTKENTAHPAAQPGSHYRNPKSLNFDDWPREISKTAPPQPTPELIAERIAQARALIMEAEGKRAGEVPAYAPPANDQGDPAWRGLFKLGEELNELGVELMKLAAFPEGVYPDNGKPLLVRLIEELTDVQVTLDYFRQQSHIPISYQRYNRKLARYNVWGLSGVEVK